MKEITTILITNLIMVFEFMLPLIFVRISDICLGSAISYKDIKLTFDYQKFLKSIIYSVITGVGLALLTMSISLLPELMKIYNITDIGDTTFQSLTNLSIIGIIATATFKRVKDCMVKFQTLNNIKNEEVIKFEMTNDGR